MKKNFFLTAAALLMSMGLSAQVQDVTSQYITNPGFEECTPLEAITPEEGNPYVELAGTYSVAGGTDYADKGWTLKAQYTYLNSAVVEYGVDVKPNQWQTYPGPAAGPEGSTGNKALLFVGNSYSNEYLCYESAEVTLPAGYYRMTYHVYSYVNTVASTSFVDMCGFVAKDGTKYTR